MKRQRQTRTVYRCSIDGRFVTKAYADCHPRITVRQTIRLCAPSFPSPACGGRAGKGARANGAQE